MDLKSANQKQVYHYALKLLSQREHSYLELTQKLNKKFKDNQDLNIQIANEVKNNNLQSEQRYCEMIIFAKVRQGYGSKHIKHIFEQFEIDEGFYQQQLKQVDWTEQAIKVLQKRGALQFDNLKVQQKQYRFLLNRGFDWDQINAAWNQLREDTQ